MLVCIINDDSAKHPGIFDRLYVEADRLWMEGATADNKYSFCDVWAKEKQYIIDKVTVEHDNNIVVISGRVTNIRTW